MSWLNLALKKLSEVVPTPILGRGIGYLREDGKFCVKMPSGVVVEPLDGVAGAKGDTGAPGPQGADGVAGAKGNTGAPGPQGAAGVTGAKGDTGAPGPQGAAGVTGAKGDTGAPGPQGAAGVAGAKGDTGAPGQQGAAGVTGAKGETGAPGQQGPQGVSGVTFNKRLLNINTPVPGLAAPGLLIHSLDSGASLLGKVVRATATLAMSSPGASSVSVNARLVLGGLVMLFPVVVNAGAKILVIEVEATINTINSAQGKILQALAVAAGTSPISAGQNASISGAVVNNIVEMRLDGALQTVATLQASIEVVG